MKRILAMVAALVMLMGIAAVPAVAEEATLDGTWVLTGFVSSDQDTVSEMNGLIGSGLLQRTIVIQNSQFTSTTSIPPSARKRNCLQFCCPPVSCRI